LPIYMLHFACQPTRARTEAEKWTADSCIIAADMVEAEQGARELIASRPYQAGELIAYAELGEEKVASLGQLEATLYLKAQQDRKQRAVVFSQWHD
jgi:hypothetical protein